MRLSQSGKGFVVTELTLGDASWVERKDKFNADPKTQCFYASNSRYDMLKCSSF